MSRPVSDDAEHFRGFNVHKLATTPNSRLSGQPCDRIALARHAARYQITTKRMLDCGLDELARDLGIDGRSDAYKSVILNKAKGAIIHLIENTLCDQNVLQKRIHTDPITGGIRTVSHWPNYTLKWLEKDWNGSYARPAGETGDIGLRRDPPGVRASTPMGYSLPRPMQAPSSLTSEPQRMVSRSPVLSHHDNETFSPRSSPEGANRVHDKPIHTTEIHFPSNPSSHERNSRTTFQAVWTERNYRANDLSPSPFPSIETISRHAAASSKPPQKDPHPSGPSLTAHLPIRQLHTKAGRAGKGPYMEKASERCTSAGQASTIRTGVSEYVTQESQTGRDRRDQERIEKLSVPSEPVGYVRTMLSSSLPSTKPVGKQGAPLQTVGNRTSPTYEKAPQTLFELGKDATHSLKLAADALRYATAEIHCNFLADVATIKADEDGAYRQRCAAKVAAARREDLAVQALAAVWEERSESQAAMIVSPIWEHLNGNRRTGP